MKTIYLTLALFTIAACSHVPSKINDDKVFFAFDSAVVTDEMQDELESQALYMKKNPEKNITLEGHCDERGSTEYNLALGALRAGNSAHIMINDGIEPTRIKTISYGKEKPQYLGTGEKVWAKNRNVTTKVNETEIK